MKTIDETTMALWGHDVWEGRMAISDSLPSVPLKLMVGTIVLCRKGHLTLVIDNNTIMLESNQILFITPGSILSQVELEDESKYMVSMITRTEIFRTSLHHRPIELIQALRTNPVINIEGADGVIADAYQRLADLVIHDRRKRPYHQQVASLLVDSFVYELLNLLTAHINPSNNWSPLFQRFVVLADVRRGSLRSVNEAAQLLCVSSKHLARVVKESCDISPLEYLDMLTLHAIVAQLRQTDLPLKDIAANFGFPNASAFGTFVRRHLGITPITIRKQGR